MLDSSVLSELTQPEIDELAGRLNITPIEPDPLPRDPWEFCRLCVYTQDEHAKSAGLEYIRPLVGEGDDYLRVLAELVTSERLLRVEKSRQLRVTWLLSALLLHRALVVPGVRIAYQSKKFEDADIYLRDRFWFIYGQIPTRYAKPRARYVSGAIEVFHERGSVIPTSQIQALAEGAEQVRQFTFSVWLSDEFAFQQDQDDALTAVKPSLDGGGQGIIVSSAAGDQNPFYRIGHVAGVYGGEKRSAGILDANKAIPAPVQIAEGVSKWKLNGWTSVRVHYLADTHKRGDWAARAKLGYSPQAWAQEQEIDFTVQPGTPIFCETEKIVVGRVCYAPWLPLLSGLDYSFLANVCVTGQIRKLEGRRYKLCITSETFASECFIKPFRDRVLAERASNYPGHEAGFTDYGDYAANQRTATGVLIEEIRPINLVTVPTGPGGVRKRIELVQRLISEGLLEIDKSCVGLVRALRVGYVWDETKRDKTGSPVPSDEHPFADFADSIGYLVSNVFELQELASGGTTVVVKDEYRGDAVRGLPRYEPPATEPETDGTLHHQVWDAFRGSGL